MNYPPPRTIPILEKILNLKPPQHASAPPPTNFARLVCMKNSEYNKKDGFTFQFWKKKLFVKKSTPGLLEKSLILQGKIQTKLDNLLTPATRISPSWISLHPRKKTFSKHPGTYTFFFFLLSKIKDSSPVFGSQK